MSTLWRVDQIEERVSAIREKAKARNDDAGCHIEQDKLFREVLQAVAAGYPRASELAVAALKVDEIDFDRWYE